MARPERTAKVTAPYTDEDRIAEYAAAHRKRWRKKIAELERELRKLAPPRKAHMIPAMARELLLLAPVAKGTKSVQLAPVAQERSTTCKQLATSAARTRKLFLNLSMRERAALSAALDKLLEKKSEDPLEEESMREKRDAHYRAMNVRMQWSVSLLLLETAARHAPRPPKNLSKGSSMKKPKLGSPTLGGKLPLKQWCQDLGITERTGQNHIARGMPHYKLGALVLVEPEEIWPWLQVRDGPKRWQSNPPRSPPGRVSAGSPTSANGRFGWRADIRN